MKALSVDFYALELGNAVLGGGFYASPGNVAKAQAAVAKEISDMQVSPDTFGRAGEG
jgi:hypothetical protein